MMILRLSVVLLFFCRGEAWLFTRLSEELLLSFRTIFNELNTIPLNIFNEHSWRNTAQSKDAGKTVTEYDFIVVGSGSSGAVVANRLSEVNQWNVLLLEAGLPEGRVNSIPMLAPMLQKTGYDWQFLMEYEPTSSQGFVDQRMPWPRGRALGGTSTINYMIYTRGNKIDFDRWTEAGNPGWSYEDVLPYYMKSERAKLAVANQHFHNKTGLLSVEDSYVTPMLNYFLEGAKELGYPVIDYNAPGPNLGVSRVHTTTHNGRRHSVAKAFLDPFNNRPNLDILTSAFVTKILIDANKKAYGVNYEINGKQFTAKATKEVILSAGTINSPQLLMLSGVGPAEHLQELGIPLVQDLAVGQNLHDHICFLGANFFINKDISLNAYQVMSPTNWYNFFRNESTSLSSIGGVEALGYIKTEAATYPEEYPDIELIFTSGSLKTDMGSVLRRVFGVRDDIYYPLFKEAQNYPDWGILPMLLHPKSTGYLKLRSTNPRQHPILHGNYFTDPKNEDIKAFIGSIRFMQKLANTKSFQRLGTRMNPARNPGCVHYEYDSDAYWECCLRSMSGTLHHQVGTCKMGPSSDPGAVVNHELKVYGVENLRVADSGVIPFALSAHTNAPAIMIGEKAADLIKAAWL